MSKKKILICDDLESTSREWGRKLKRLQSVTKNFVVEDIKKSDFVKALAGLEKRRADARSAGEKTTTATKLGDHLFDDIAILVVDYDLLALDETSHVTGESVAYLARCYSRCGVIVGLNQFGDNTFDLTLKGHPESFADFNIGDKQLDNRGLWAEPWSGFRPWYWPLVPLSVEKYENRIQQVQKNLDREILDFLGLAKFAEILPRSILEFIQGRSKKTPNKITFRSFVMEAGNGLQRRDRPFDDSLIARIAAARIAKWMERFVLPGQDILVDAPHLVSRYASLLTGDSKKLSTWNKTASFEEPRKLGLRYSTIEKFRYRHPNWLSREAWFWSDVSNCQEIKEVENPWVSNQPAVVFCEDISRFRRLKDTSEFVAELPSPFARRFVVDTKTRAKPNFKHVSYRPNVRFSI